MTTAADLIDPPARDDIERDRVGRPLVTPPEGGKRVAYSRATTIAGTLDDYYGLSRWQQRMVALGLAERSDLLLAVSATDRADTKRLSELTDQAQEAARASASATIGTALHALAERRDRGLPLGTVPAEYRADLDAYDRATAELEPLAVEQFTVLDEHKIGGTPDRVVRYRGRCYIADLKTGADITYSALKISIQLAIYAHAQPYDPTTGQRYDYPEPVDQDWGIVLHAPAGQGRCQPHWIDLARGWQALGLALQVRAWRKAKRLVTAWGEADAPAADPLTLAVSAIRQAADLDTLRAQYRRAVGAGLDRDAVLAACLARRTELEQQEVAVA